MQFEFKLKFNNLCNNKIHIRRMCAGQNNAGDCVGTVFIDFEKGSDTFWLNGLFFKIIKKNFNKILQTISKQKPYYLL